MRLVGLSPLLCLALLLDARQLVCPYAEELLQGFGYQHRVYRAVEPAEASCLEEAEEVHQLGEFEPAEVGDYHLGELLELPVVELVLYTAVLREVDQLTHRPCLCRAVAVCVPHVNERGGFAGEYPRQVLRVGVLVVGVEGLQQADLVAVPLKAVSRRLPQVFGQ